MTTKEKGDVYTPEHIVEHVLDVAGYTVDSDILEKKIIDPSCGDGAFLSVVVKRIISAGRLSNMDDGDIADLIVKSVSGIEIVEDEAAKCRNNIETVCKQAGISIAASKLDIVCADTLDEYPNRIASYDFVVGNPPYVRIHNLENTEAVQSLSYCEKGMTDLYLAFYELGQALCADNGVLCYIAPSSWFASKSAIAMRDDLKINQRLSTVVDLQHIQPFEGITTYTAIVKITPCKKNDSIEFATFDEYLDRVASNSTDTSLFSSIPYEEAWINGLFVPIADDGMRNKIKDIMTAKSKECSVSVKNGFATNLDRFYIRPSFSDENKDPAPVWIRSIAKSSTAKWSRCFYPYDKNGRILPLETFKGYDIYDDLLAEKEALLARNQISPDAWWGYARSQGIADVEKDKVAVNTLYRDKNDVKVLKVDAGKCVYGGVYVLGMTIQDVKRACTSDVYMEYVCSLRKYKSGGYYTLGGKELERFLQWWTFDQDQASK